MNAAAALRVIVEANTGPASASLAKFDAQLKSTAAAADASMGQVATSTTTAGKRMESAGRSITGVGKAIGLATAPLALFAGASAKMAFDFRRQMGLVATDAGGTAKEVKKLEHSVLGLARSSKFGPTALAESLFHVESSGYRGAKAMKVLNEAQKLATTGNSDLQTTTYALVSATKALYGDSLKNVNRTAAELNGIVAHGDVRLEELTAAMSTGVIPKAKAMGLNLRDVGAALDVMTARGIPAQRAAYALGFTFQKLVPYGEKAEEVFESIGLGQEELVKKAQTGKFGYVSALEDLQHHLDTLPTKPQQTKAIEEMFGGGRMTSGLLTNLQNLGEMRKKYQELGDEVQKYNRHVKEAEEQPKVKLEKAWANIQASMTEIGSALIPLIVPGFEHLASFAEHITSAFTGLSPEMQSAIVKAGLFTIGLSGTLIVVGKVAEGIGAIRTAMEGIAATNLVTGMTGGLGDMRAALSLAAGGEAGGLSMVGGEWASALMGGLARALPMAAAGIGIANIVVSATHGDWHDAGFEAGGALVGGIAGAIVGGPMGAALGVGIGSLGGELLGHLLGGTKHLTVFQAALAASSGNVKHAMEGERNAASQLHMANQKLVTIGHHQRKVTGEIHEAEQNLTQIRKTHKDGSPAVVEAEGHLEILKRRLIRLTHEQGQAEKLQGSARKAFQVEAKFAAATLKERIGLLQEEAKKAQHKYEIDQKGGATTKELEADSRRWNRVLKESGKAQTEYQNLLSTAASSISPKYAHFLATASSLQLRTGKTLGQISGAMHELGLKIPSISEQMQQWGHHGKEASSHVQTGIQKAQESVESYSEAAQKGLGNVAKAYNPQAKHFGLTPMPIFGEKAIGKQRGGPINLGAPTGDSVPAMLERGEYVLNRNAVAAMGTSNLDALNFGHAPRFQKGGMLGREPRMTGPHSDLRSLGQAAIHDIYQGAQHSLAKHRSAAGADLSGISGSVASVFAQVAKRLHAPRHASMALFEAGLQESGLRNLSYGDGSSTGALQVLASTAAGMGIDPMNPAQVAAAFLLRGFYGHGGAISIARQNPGLDPGTIAQMVQGSAYPSAYAPHAAQARALLRQYGLQHGGLVGLAAGGSVASGRALTAGQLHFLSGGGHGSADATHVVKWAQAHLGQTRDYGYPEEWCGAFLGADMKAHGIEPPGGYPLAANWAGWGTGDSSPRYGDVVVIGGSGHVGLALGGNKMISGNFSSKVAESTIGEAAGGRPILGYRTPPYTHASSKNPGETKAQETAHTYKEKVPAVFHGAKTKSLSLSGSVPKSMPGINKEIARRQHELGVYRHAAGIARQAHRPGVAQAIEHNIAALEKRIRELSRARKKLRVAIAKKRFTATLKRAYSGIAGRYGREIEESKRNYEIANQFAEQVVGLEPQEPSLSPNMSEGQREVAEKQFGEHLAGYIVDREDPAYLRVLGTEADWRNKVIGAEHAATGLGVGFEARIRNIDHAIAKAKSTGGPKVHERLAMLNFKRHELATKLGEARGLFFGMVPKDPLSPPAIPLRGSGTFEEDLIEVQGVHWPDQHEMLPIGALRHPRQAGRFGNAIWDTQTSIDELGLKISQAISGGVGGGGGGGASGGKTEREELLEELLLQANQRELVRTIGRETIAGFPYAGAYATGGVVSALVGEKGPEIAAFPTGTRIHSASESRQMLSPNLVIEELHVHPDGSVSMRQEGRDVTATVKKVINEQRGVGAAATVGVRR